MTEFVAGLDLCEAYYREVVRPALDTAHPGLVHGAALLGPGSEVLGFDSEMSTDHDWGARVDLFLREEDFGLADDIAAALAEAQPPRFGGHATSAVRPTTVSRLLRRELGLEGEMRTADWLSFPEHRLRTLVGGRVFHDGDGALAAMRERLRHYPEDVQRYLLAGQWQRVGQEEPFVGRTGMVGDGLGSTVLAARLVRDAMRLAFLLERSYAPYPKWFGSAFARLSCAAELTPSLEAALRCERWEAREAALGRAFCALARLQNGLGLAAPVATELRAFHDRPFRVIGGEEIADALRAAIGDPEVRGWPAGLGSVDQLSDSTDLLTRPRRCRQLLQLFAKDPEPA